MSNFRERYMLACKALREECDQLVTDGEMTEHEANFRYDMVRDEILWEMEE